MSNSVQKIRKILRVVLLEKWLPTDQLTTPEYTHLKVRTVTSCGLAQLQFSPLGELEPGVVIYLLVSHFSEGTALRIFLIFCTELDIDKWWKLTGADFSWKLMNPWILDFSQFWTPEERWGQNHGFTNFFGQSGSATVLRLSMPNSVQKIRKILRAVLLEKC